MVDGRVKKADLLVTLGPVPKDGLVRDVLVDFHRERVGGARLQPRKLQRGVDRVVGRGAREGDGAVGQAAVGVAAGLEGGRVDGDAVVSRPVDGYVDGGADHLVRRPAEGGEAVAEQVEEGEGPANALLGFCQQMERFRDWWYRGENSNSPGSQER